MDNLDRWVLYWQRRFRLNDWKITARVGRPAYIDENTVRTKAHAITEWNPGEMTARITMAKNACNRTLCHEILHIVIDGEGECPGYVAATERKIERIVDCIFEKEPVLPEVAA